MPLTLRCVSSILRPGFFMENFEGVIGAISTSFFREGLHEDTTLAVIVSCCDLSQTRWCTC